MRLPSLFALLPLFALACNTADPAGEQARPAQIGEAKSELSRNLTPSVSDAAKTELVRQNTEFALALFRKSATPTENLVQSPHSLSTALAMTFAGADGQTKTDIATALHFTLPDEELHSAFNWLDLEIESRAKDAKGKDGKPARVHVDNLLFSANDVTLAEPYLDTIALNYGAGVQLVDFGDSATVDVINGWVSQRTEQRIPKLLQPNSVDADTRLVLLNTVYINSAWQSPFQKSAMQDGTFTSPLGARTVPFLFQSEQFDYFRSDSAQIIELNLATEGLAFDVILPDAELAAFEAEQTEGSLSTLFSSLQPQQVALHLPKFKLEPADQGSLKKPLSELGMASVFERANFSRMMPEEENLYVADVIHKTFFEIDEDGLEAAAASAVIVNDESAAAPSEIEMRVDRPFMVVLRDKPTGQVLFLGHIVAP